jgi:hypothetical protein
MVISISILAVSANIWQYLSAYGQYLLLYRQYLQHIDLVVVGVGLGPENRRSGPPVHFYVFPTHQVAQWPMKQVKVCGF